MIKKTAHIIILILISASCYANTITRPVRTIKELVSRIIADKKYCKKLKITEPGLLAEFYRENNYKLQWYSGEDGTSNREKLFSIISTNNFMLDINEYASIKIIKKKCFTKQDTLLNEIRMTDLALYLFKDVAYSHQSFVKYNGLHYRPACLNFTWYLGQALKTGNFEKYLQDCEPECDQYQQLKAVYLRLNDSLNSFRHTTIMGPSLSTIKTRLAKIKYAASLYRWISCVHYKACIVINLASKKLSYSECSTEAFTCNIDPGNISAAGSTMAASIKSIKFYYDAQYPSNLQFEFDNPFNISLCSLPGEMANHNATKEIRIDKAGQLADILGIDRSRLLNNICPEEATPFATMAARYVPMFIVNVPMDF